MRDNNSDYPFTKDNVEEFIEFCEGSNGFVDYIMIAVIGGGIMVGNFG
jgi:hypothetical protein